MPGSDFKISSERIGDRIEWVSIGGELDLGVASEVRDYLAVRLHDPEIGSLVLDLSNLRFIDSTGLHVVVRTARSADDLGRRLVVVGSSPQVRRVLELTGVAAFLT